jgi:exopolysaccharide biosynthesis polyprenyl glycosylphosphotransferase
MKRTKRPIQDFLVGIIMVGLCVLCVHPAWATLSFVKSDEKSPAFVSVDDSEIPSLVERESRARAPEPATMALFGGGFLGMLMSFVRRTYACAKRILDRVLALAGIAVLSPVLLVTALLVKLTSQGPIFYSQTRVGKNGRLFRMYKFRTMKTDAEKETGPVWATRNDSRLTCIGGFLRKVHMDELPQLINILKGEMNLIGPRPERPVFVEKFKEMTPDYEKRLAVKPGITGLAQVWHRYDETIEDVKKKLKYDLLYIKKMCFWSDFNIVMRTFVVITKGAGDQDRNFILSVSDGRRLIKR